MIQKIEYVKHLKNISAKIYQYRRHRLNLNEVAMGVFLISYSMFESDDIKILAVTSGVYLIVDAISNFMISKKFKTNILVIEGVNLINLNGQYNSINLTKIKDYEETSNEIILKTLFEKHTIRKAKFINAEGLIEQIKEKIKK